MSNNNISDSFFGKYRGVVTDNKDPLKLGRIRAKVPVIFGENDSGWALPCSPYAGKNVGFFCIPPIDALVWIEFESGNPETPIWTGGFWKDGETPDESASPDIKILKTDTNTIKLDDTSGAENVTIETNAGLKIVLNQDGIEATGAENVTIETNAGLKIVLNQDGIELSNSSQKIKIASSGVSINDGALEVM
ncbi:MAG: phage baseplate assembly protein V [Candidatus Bathyarchaeota archaeon]|nr:phage baseplate assembly protein V [Candidatus Termiticorpusculum sp.]MCL2869060.1 phage baseplate assembly protein V [Candidatus Termiticorpusculum sp.]